MAGNNVELRLCFVHVPNFILFQGLCAEISGPTLPYLRLRLDINYEEISRALVAKSVGFFIGTLAGGALSQKWRQLKELWVSLSLIAAAIGTVFSPYSTNLALLAFLFAMDGFGKGGIAAGKWKVIILQDSTMVGWSNSMDNIL